MQKNQTHLFFLFAGFHALVWTLLPSFVVPNMPLDCAEILSWGKEWQLGYWKHPPLVPWVAEIFIQLTGLEVWGLYLASQLAIFICFWAVWRLARHFLGETESLLAALMLGGIHYYSFTSPEFNHNILLLPFWALTTLYFWKAIQSSGAREWIWLGLFAGLGLLTKYSMLILLLALAIFLVIDSRTRVYLLKKGPYLAVGIALIVIAPHLVWLARHEFISVKYGLQRSAANGGLSRHLFYPFQFALGQLWALLPACVIGLIFSARSLGKTSINKSASLSHRFLTAVCFGPFLIYVLLSLLFGLKLKDMWGSPLWSFAGIFLMYWLRPEMTKKRLSRFGTVLACFAVLWLGAYSVQYLWGPYLIHKPKRGHFPGRALAQEITERWAARFETPLEIVAGDYWIAGNISFYSPYRPSVYRDLDPSLNSWTDDRKLQDRGGVLVWDAGKQGTAPPWNLEGRINHLYTQPQIELPYLTPAEIAPAQIGWAIIPPKEVPGPTDVRKVSL